MRRLPILLVVLSACGPVSVGAPVPGIRPHEITVNLESAIFHATSRAVPLTLDAPNAVVLDLDPSTVPAGVTVDLGKGPMQPGEERHVLLAFRPTTLDPVDATIVIGTPGLEAKDVRITVKATVSDVCPVGAYPEILDFGEVHVDTSRTLPMEVGPLNGADGHIDIASTDPAFTVYPTSVDVASGGASTINVTFLPTGPEGHDAYLHLNPCASGLPTTVRVRGSGGS